MKKISLLLAFGFSVSAAFSQTLFTYGNASVDKGEFIRAYNKNKTQVPDKEKALREYLDLYIKFKLKVSAARELRLDTLPQLQFDAQSFRGQIEESYLSSEKELNTIIDEAFSRSQKDLHVLHFFAPVATSADSINAIKAINNIYTGLSSGKTDHDKLVEAEQGKVKQADIGFITAFTLPYEYENLIYGLRIGQASKPYLTKKGWHVFKLIEERKAVGKWKVAQILFAVPPDQQADKTALAKRADSVYQLLQKGADFALLAKQFSDDKITYAMGGELPEFGSGKFEPSFEKEVFNLTRDGEISRPFLSSFGYHIIKRMSQSPVPSDRNDNAFLFDLKQKIQQDSRINSARESFVKEVFKQVNFRKTGAVPDAELFRYADSVIKYVASENGSTANYPISNKVIYVFGKAKVTGKEWLDFISNYKGNAELYQGEDNNALLQKFVSSITLDYYKKNLEDYNTDFRYQMEEFRDGNVLFEIMERNIWGKAANDTEGLLKHYNENKRKYTWAASADIILFNCANKAIAEATKDALKSGKNWKKIAEESNNTLQADSGRFELSQIPITIDPGSAAGFISDIVINPTDGTASFAKVIKPYEANLQRNFDEAKGLVINDYQNILEDKWISDLRKKYPVKVNEAVFQSLLK